MTITTVLTVDQNLDAAVAAVKEEVGRTDNKASLLLAFNGAGLAGLASLASNQLPLNAWTFGGLSAVALGCSASLLLLVVRPNLSGADRASFPYWATLTSEDDLRSVLSEDRRLDSVAVLSRLAMRKYRRLRLAIDISLGSLALLTIAAVSAL